MNRRSKSVVLKGLFTALQEEDILRVGLEVLALDNSSLTVHRVGTGVSRKMGRQLLANPGAVGTPSFI